MLIAQITDTHLKLPGKLAYKRVDTAQMLRDCVAELLKLDPQPDLVVHTGDLTDFGLPDEYDNPENPPCRRRSSIPAITTARGNAAAFARDGAIAGARLPAVRCRAWTAAIRRPRYRCSGSGRRRALR